MVGVSFRRGAKVTLFESEHRPGGHTLTDDSPGYSVDLGFQVKPHILISVLKGAKVIAFAESSDH